MDLNVYTVHNYIYPLDQNAGAILKPQNKNAMNSQKNLFESHLWFFFLFSFTIEMADGRQEIHLLRGVELHEGTEVKHQLKVPTRSTRKVVAKMEILEPELLS